MRIVYGNILDVTEGYIMQQCNCVTTKPKGLSYDIEEQFPGTCPYFLREKNEVSVPGTCLIINSPENSVEGFPAIINVFGQFYPGGPRANRPDETPDSRKDRLGYFREALDALVDYFKTEQDEDVVGNDNEQIQIAVPYKIGCGLAKGNWVDYNRELRLFEKKMVKAGVNLDLVIYRL